jgi:hypothetical protein
MLGILAIASAVIAALSFFANNRVTKIKHESVENILADMDSIIKAYPTMGCRDLPSPLDTRASSVAATDEEVADTSLLWQSCHVFAGYDPE